MLLHAATANFREILSPLYDAGLSDGVHKHASSKLELEISFNIFNDQ